jgi:hypothetical protein
MPGAVRALLGTRTRHPARPVEPEQIMTKAKITGRRTSKATEPKSATTAEVKPERKRGKGSAVEGRGQMTTAAASPNAHPTGTLVLDAPATGTPKPQRQTKAALPRARLAEPDGVSLAALMAATGWQAHTLRAALSGLRKGGLTLTRRSEGDDTIYAIAPCGAPAAAEVAPGAAAADSTTAMGDTAGDHRASPAPATGAAGDAHVAEGSPAPSDASPALRSSGTAA